MITNMTAGANAAFLRTRFCVIFTNFTYSLLYQYQNLDLLKHLKDRYLKEIGGEKGIC